MTTGSRYVALLRAINVGGHIVKMDALRKHFTKLGFANVETFIASGNVLFDAPGAKPRELEERIAFELERILGYPVATFVRSPGELASIVRHEPFDRQIFDIDEHPLYVGFLAAKPTAEAIRKVAGMRSPVDELHVHGRELYWGCRTRFSDSEITGALLERTVGTSMTIRNVTTVRKLAAKVGG